MSTRQRPTLSLCDRCRLVIAGGTLSAGAVAYLRHHPDRIIAIAVLFVVGWVFIDKVEPFVRM